MSFLEKVLIQANPIIATVLSHPFTKGIDDGTLCKEKFLEFLKQDSFYLPVYTKALEKAASLFINETEAMQFKKYATESLAADEMVNKLYEAELRKRVLHEMINRISFFSKPAQRKKNDACLQYCQHLKTLMDKGNLPVLIAGLLPCFYLYRLLGQRVDIQQLSQTHPYHCWIISYADPGFYQSVENMVKIFEHLATNANEDTQQSMQEAFLASMRCEKAFFDEAFNNTLKLQATENKAEHPIIYTHFR